MLLTNKQHVITPPLSQLLTISNKENPVKKSRGILALLFVVLIIPFYLSSSCFAAQTQQMRTTQGQTAAPATHRASPQRARSVTKATPKSLLCITKISISPASPRVGDKVTIHATVKNNGPKTVKNVKVTFYLGRKNVAWATYNIKSGATQDYQGIFTQKQAPRAGDYAIKVVVDPNQTLERRFYKCNAKSVKITIQKAVARRSGTTINRGKIASGSATRHTGVESKGQVVGKATPSKNARINSSSRPSSTRNIHPGKITNVTVKIYHHTGTVTTRNLRTTSTFDIRWTRSGILPTHVDIFLHPYRRAGKGQCLKRSASNNGHFTIPVPGKLNANQKYIVLIQTHDGKVKGTSRSFSISYKPPKVTGQYSRAASTARQAGKGGVAATPISIPRAADVSPHKKTSRGQHVALDPGIGPNSPAHEKSIKSKSRHVALDPGIGPNRLRSNSAAANKAVQEKLHINDVTTYLTITWVSPKQGDTWINNKTYSIKWATLKSPLKLEKILLKSVDKNNNIKTVQTLYPSGKITSAGGLSKITYKVPATMKGGSYLIRLKITEKVNGKTKSYTKDSGVFMISWAEKMKVIGIAQIPDLSKLLPYAKDMPMITYFEYDKIVTKGLMLNVKFYWKDGKKNLFNGSWTVETKEKGTTTWQKHSGKIADLVGSTSFHGAQGLCIAEFSVFSNMGGNTPIRPTSFRFFLTDANGIKSNVITGAVNAANQAQTLISHSGIHFLTPPPIFQGDGTWRMTNPLKPGEKINIQLLLDVPANTSSIPLTIELYRTNGSISPAAKLTTTVKTGGGGHEILRVIPWKIPAKYEGEFILRAMSSKFGKPTKSAIFPISQNPEKQKRLYIISPQANREAQIGSQVTIQWRANGFNPKAIANIIFYSENHYCPEKVAGFRYKCLR